MKEIRIDKGLVGLSRCFKEAVTSCGCTGKLLFVGTAFTCLPFAEFLSYVIRELPIATYFSPEGDTTKIAEIKPVKDFGFALGDVVKEKSFDIIVLLGGLAMPNSQVDASELKTKLLKVSKLDYVIGFCFQGVMKKPEWIKEFGFRYFIDADLSRVSLMEGPE